MPTITQWTNPAVFLIHKGITIFHVYEDNDVGQGVKKYAYTTDNTSDDNSFDIRQLDVQNKQLLTGHPPFISLSDAIYREATPEQRADFKRGWKEWQKPEGGEDQAIKAVLKEAIELGLITESEQQ